MTKFAKYLQRHCVNEWSGKYVHYKQLKKIINRHHRTSQSDDQFTDDVASTPQSAQRQHEDEKAPSLPRPSYSGLLDLLDDPLADTPLLTSPHLSSVVHGQETELELLDLRATTPLSAMRSRHPQSSHADAGEMALLENLPSLPSSVSAATAEFWSALTRDVDDIQRFYREKEAEVVARVDELVRILSCHGVHLLSLTESQERRAASQCKTVYRVLLLLHNYRTLNYIAVCKIVKKHDKVVPLSPLTSCVIPLLDRLYCFASRVPQRCMYQLITLYAKTLLHTDDEENARRQLEFPGEEAPSSRQKLLLGVLAAVCGLGVTLTVMQGIVIKASSTELPAGALAALSMYRLLGVLLLHSTLWVACLRTLKVVRVNCVLILGMNADSVTPVSHLAIFLGVLAVMYLFSLNLYLLLWQLIARSLIDNSALVGVFFVHFVTFALVFGLCCQPVCPTLRSARRYFRSVLMEVLRLPFSTVSFQATFLANQGTSLMQCLPDFSFSLCFYMHAIVTSSYVEPTVSELYCSTFNFAYISWWLASLPNAWRCIQCWKKYRGGAGVRNLGNTVKYFNRLILATFDGLHSHNIGPSHTTFALWVTFEVLNISYSYYWDVAQDWGLFRTSWRSRHPLLREQVVLSRKVWYYVCMVINLGFRVLSVFTVSPGVFFGSSVSSSWTATVLYEGESLRRSLWNFFRLENEHSLNVANFRAVKLTPFHW